MEKQHYHISEDFLSELIKACLTSKAILDIAIKHLQYHYIVGEAHKLLFQRIVQVYELENSLPTIGSLSQDFNKNENVLRLLQKIKNIIVSEKKDILLQTFEKFLINVKFLDLYGKIGRLHNEGQQQKAIKLLETEATIIANFTIKDHYYTTVFNAFNQRQQERQSQEKKQLGFNKVPFSIHCLDSIMRGGMDKGTSTLVMARSGGGKSTFMKWVGMSAARSGMRVFHFQGEGTEREALDAYDAGWTSEPLEQIEFGVIVPEKVRAIEKAHKDIVASGGEVYVKASENFDELSLNDCNELIDDMVKVHGAPDIIIFDYMEMFTVSGKYYNSESGERKRREDIANKMTNIAVMKNAVVLTGIQSNDVKPELYNNADFVLTRSNIAEYKGAIKPFSNFITLNMTDDEFENSMCRIYVDKLRKYKSRQTYRICTSFSNSRMYNSKKTLDLFWNDKLNTPIKK